MINTSIQCIDWIARGVDITVAVDGHRPIIGRDLFSKLGFFLTQLKQVANINQNQCLIKKQIAFDFPGLITRIGKSLKHSVKSLDVKYAYSQLNLDPETARHCNFNIISGEGTGTYRFITGFYGLTDMPAAFQKVMDYTLVGLQNTHCFLDDFIIVSRGSKEEHLKLVYKCLKNMDEDNLRINLSECHFAKTEIEWLGHKFNQSGIAPLESKTAAILTLSAPKNLKTITIFPRLCPLFRNFFS